MRHAWRAIVLFAALAAPALEAMAQAPGAAGTSPAKNAAEARQPGPAPAAAPTSCVTCHRSLGGALAAPTENWQADVHAAAGLDCHDCHGGDPSPALSEDSEGAMNRSKGFRGKPTRLGVPQFCGRCHADADYMKRFDPQARVDQLVEYRTSVHGIRNAAGDSVPATCIDCHGVHGIRPVTSPDAPVYATNVPTTCARCHANAALMAPYGIPTNQYEEYRKSVHAIALFDLQDTSAPACNDCHGNHGAVPPGVTSVANVCGQCHGREGALFGASFKKALFDSTGVPGCLACHENHAVQHPTPELFHSASAPRVSQGSLTSTAPLAADLGELAAGDTATVTWRTVLAPHLEAQDQRYRHSVRVSAGDGTAMVLDATILPGAEEWPEPRRQTGGGLEATLRASFPSGTPVQPGDAVVLHLELEARAAARAQVQVSDSSGSGLHTLPGSVCMNCHSTGDACDVATGKMYAAVVELDRNLRSAAALLHRAETAGMDVSRAQFDLRSKGTTAAVESRALVHSFDPERLLERTRDGEEAASAARRAGEAAMHELQFRRRGLAVSLILVAMVLVAVGLKIRQIDRDRSAST